MSVSPVMSLLQARGSGRVLSHASLRRMVERHTDRDNVSASVVIDSLVNVKAIHKVTDGIYLNCMADPLPSPAEALKHVVPEGVLSLHMVLGQAGVINNPTQNYTCIRPSSPITSEGELQLIGQRFNRHNPSPLYWAHTMDAKVIDAGDPADNIDATFSYPRATVEKAFCDWIYLASRDTNEIGGQPPLDCDLDIMDRARLTRIASAMGITRELSAWMDRHHDYLADEDVDANMSTRFGF